MARLARIVIPRVPHHVTQRGNRRQTTFFSAADFALYKELITTWCRRLEVEVWAYCLMPNHVHLILAPPSQPALVRAVAETHRRYTLAVNRREGWKGFLWQGRFASFPMDETHVVRAARYILLNPVNAGLAASAESWPHSSAAAHLHARPDGVVALEPLARRIPDWQSFIARGFEPAEAQELEAHQRTGRPLGAPEFVSSLESAVGAHCGHGSAGPGHATRRNSPVSYCVPETLLTCSLP